MIMIPLHHDIRVFRDRLHINKNRLDEELERHAVEQEMISERLSTLNSRLIEAADELKRVEAECFAEAKDDGKSDKACDASVKTDGRRKTAWQKWQAARSEHEEWQGLYEAWKSRGYVMKELTALYLGQYFAVDSAGARPQASRTDYSQFRQHGHPQADIQKTQASGTRRRAA